jgi:hypothetical protein
MRATVEAGLLGDKGDNARACDPTGTRALLLLLLLLLTMPLLLLLTMPLLLPRGETRCGTKKPSTEASRRRPVVITHAKARQAAPAVVDAFR